MLLKQCQNCEGIDLARYVLVDRGRQYNMVECRRCGERHILAVWQATADLPK